MLEVRAMHASNPAQAGLVKFAGEFSSAMVRAIDAQMSAGVSQADAFELTHQAVISILLSSAYLSGGFHHFPPSTWRAKLSRIADFIKRSGSKTAEVVAKTRALDKLHAGETCGNA